MDYTFFIAYFDIKMVHYVWIIKNTCIKSTVFMLPTEDYNKSDNHWQYKLSHKLLYFITILIGVLYARNQ